MPTIRVSGRELHAILAALRLYQEMSTIGLAKRRPWIEELASNGGQVAPLDAAGLDRLCERLNFQEQVR